MQVHRGIENLPVFTNSVITIGTFDGVHEGHRKIISSLVNQARKVNGESVIITFDPHPRKVVKPDESLQLINTLEEKIELLTATGIDHLVIVSFTKEFADLTAEQYISDFLIKNFQPNTIIIGYDHHFGKNRQGNFLLMEEKAPAYHYTLLEIPKHELEHIGISSTKIRTALLESDIATANKLLGYEFFFEGAVIHGDKLGRKLGYPTANLSYTDPEKIHLGYGIYAVHVVINERILKGMLSIGNRPTLVNSDDRVEVNMFDFDEEIYGETIRVIVKKYLRGQEKYNSLDELVVQLGKDKQESLDALA
jgi:riboflavin kinase/FMN adenylyltransferase